MSSDGKEAHRDDGVAIDLDDDGDNKGGNAADRADMYRMGKMQELRVRAGDHRQICLSRFAKTTCCSETFGSCPYSAFR